MLRRFRPEEAVRVATDSIYIQKTALYKLEGIGAYIVPKACDCGREYCVSCMTGKKYLPTVAPAQWRDKGEQLYMPQEHAAYLPKAEYMSQQKDFPLSTAPRYDDPLTRHQLNYLNGCEVSRVRVMLLMSVAYNFFVYY